MPAWYEDEALLNLVSQSLERKTWEEENAFAQYFEIEQKLPADLKGSQRMGALTVAEMRGIEGRHFWMVPIEGHKKLLGPNNEVKLLDPNGTVFFEGKWAEVHPDWIRTRNEFFIWMKPREEASQKELPLSLKIKGFIRYLLHRKRV